VDGGLVAAIEVAAVEEAADEALCLTGAACGMGSEESINKRDTQH
jgi:hypothetical protein